MADNPICVRCGLEPQMAIRRVCRLCRNEEHRVRYANLDPEVRRLRRQLMTDNERLRKYGVSREKFDAMSLAQDGRCAVCGVIPSRLVVDHHHGTGMVRDLLCNNCNTALGMANEDPDRLLDLALYLERHRGR